MNKLAGINANITINDSGCDGIITGGYGKDYSGGSNELERAQTEPDSTSKYDEGLLQVWLYAHNSGIYG